MKPSAEAKKLVKEFGAQLLSDLDSLPDFYTFKKGILYSHRNFDKYFTALKAKEKCAIVSGFNASGTIHLGHLGVFKTNLFFQKKYGVKVFIPISDDESYVVGKVKTQEEGLKNALALAKEILALGFDPKKNILYHRSNLYRHLQSCDTIIPRNNIQSDKSQLWL